MAESSDVRVITSLSVTGRSVIPCRNRSKGVPVSQSEKLEAAEVKIIQILIRCFIMVEAVFLISTGCQVRFC